jgi:hypothetical protein
MQFSGTYPADTPQPIKMKFNTIDYIGEINKIAQLAKKWLESVGWGQPRR